MRFLLSLYLNPVGFESLSGEDRDAVFAGHEAFQAEITEFGEFVETKALIDPAGTRTVRVRGGRARTTSGLYQPADEYLCGYYVVDCRDEKRAIELAARIPDARYTAVEVRQIVHEA